MTNRGRPTKFSEEVFDKFKEYLLSCRDIRDGKNFTVKLPTVEGLALHLGVHRDTLYEWGTKNKDFSDTLERLSSEQKERLVNQGLAGNYNPAIARLVLSTNHGMSEKNVTELSGVDGQPIATNLTVEFISPKKDS